MAKADGGISSLGTTLTFINRRACSDTLFHVISGAFGHPMKTEEKAAQPFAGGIMQHGYQCGMIWGATLAAGAQAFRRYGPTPRAEARAIMAAQRVVDSFRASNKHVDCVDITDLDKSSSTKDMLIYFLLKGGTVGCFRMAARYAPIAYREISAAFEQNEADSVEAPVSCAALLARKMGASDERAVMAAGLAGGIGLCGGACGALGAALWLLSIKIIERGEKIDYKNPEGAALIEKFLKHNDYELECAQIVGHKFETAADHASYLCDGGCSALIDALAR